jgi:glycosyltransferase involved in cell wall biosynthesis
MITWIAAAGCLLALIPAVMFLRNLSVYRPAPKSLGNSMTPLSVLIPARDEELNIAAAVRSILENRNAEFEVVVLDDGSTDRTAGVVRELAAADLRVRLEIAPPLPAGWCGKQHACHILAQLARNPLLVFMDADVRLGPDALARMTAFMDRSGAALASGFPRQVTRTFSERLLIPLIHFVLLGFLPIRRMRAGLDPACGAGCGQLFIARRDAYRASGGHGMIRDSLHDGAKLPRVFRAAGFHTDLFDATDLAVCRMFLTDAEVWRGLGRNAGEGLGSARLIGPTTVLLFGGQVLPVILLAAFCLGLRASPLAFLFSITGVVAAYLPRLLGLARFRQSLIGALLHPVGICALLAIQWLAFFRSLRKRPSVWRGRAYLSAQAS